MSDFNLFFFIKSFKLKDVEQVFACTHVDETIYTEVKHNLKFKKHQFSGSPETSEFDSLCNKDGPKLVQHMPTSLVGSVIGGQG